jgi:hypothetical protein
MTPRSPLMIIFSIVFLASDAIGNTILFSLKQNVNPWYACLSGVFITVVCQFGLMMMIFLRMFRIYKVFSVFEEYLSWQK